LELDPYLSIGLNEFLLVADHDRDADCEEADARYELERRLCKNPSDLPYDTYPGDYEPQPPLKYPRSA
ncbi:unnamed protein product, partial [Amoebophrya sp. A25]